MSSLRKILLIDKASDRKDRIGTLKSAGYAVFPALQLEDARSRCMRGGYDLIVVNTEGQEEEAAKFCDDLRKSCPQQQLLMSTRNPEAAGDRDYAAPSDPAELLKRVNIMLREADNPGDYANAA